ncbi:xaa-Pro aminopeptidase 3-like [Mytilus galloprovincialis]|uniref:xaa-Pro aminopeptidase 3-like n=1 Tax=Mytilus galloprovincialis TaxID=29158 RepID=UPI003F7CBA21
MKVCIRCLSPGSIPSFLHKRTCIRGVSCVTQSYIYQSRRWFGQPAAQTHPHLIKEGEVTPGITKEEYRNRRHLLSSLALQTEKSRNHIMLVPSATKQFMSQKIPYPFHQNTDFLYLCGFMEPDSLLVMQCNNSESANTTLFVPKRNIEEEKWDGPRSGIEGTIQLTGVDKAFNNTEIEGYLSKYLCDNSDFVLWYNEKAIVNRSLQEGVLKNFVREDKHYKNENVITALQALKVLKSPTEIEIMRKSCAIASESFIEVMKYSYPGVNEHYLYAKMDYECRIRDAEILAYPPVVAGGNRANTIHYINNNKIIEDGDLVLMDAGCEYHGYCSDITRTWPVSGKFTDEQRCIYDIVLRIQKKCLECCVPGQTMNQIYVYMLDLMGKELQKIGIIPQNCSNLVEAAKPFCPHHVSHYLGMDLHDTDHVTTNQQLQPGMVITIEPGIYLPEDSYNIPSEFRGMGIRIEDNVLITSSKPEVLSSGAPKEPEEIEMIMARS